MVTISNLQLYRQIMSPGWTLGWTWAKKEVIWSMVGARAIDQGDCSKFKGNDIPHSCERSPAIVDLLSGVPKNQQFTSCCKGRVLGSLGQDQAAAVSSFQVSVGHSGTSKKTVKVPKDFYLLGPGLGYACSSAMIVPSSIFFSSDGRRKTRAMNRQKNGSIDSVFGTAFTTYLFQKVKAPPDCLAEERCRAVLAPSLLLERYRPFDPGSSGCQNRQGFM
ncbi:hypothetical protein DITRI_Ditri04bG0038100 [Diplodiscus trichospermus]